MPVEVEALVGEAQAALARGEWAAARASFEASLEGEETPEALLGLSEALWWLADTEGAVRCGERAYAAFRRREELVPAVLAAMQLYFLSRVSLGNLAAARGWLGRAVRLVDEHALAPLEGWVLLLRAHASGDPAAAEAWAGEARELGRRFGDSDLELCALSQLGAALVGLGRVEEGGALLDEAMAASLAGEGDDLKTVVFTSCNMISASSEIAEMERAAQWIGPATSSAAATGARTCTRRAAPTTPVSCSPPVSGRRQRGSCCWRWRAAGAGSGRCTGRRCAACRVAAGTGAAGGGRALARRLRASRRDGQSDRGRAPRAG